MPESVTQEAPYAGLYPEWPDAAPPLSAQLDELKQIVLWLSKQQWEQDQSQTWEGLRKAFLADQNPEPKPELPNKGFRVSK